jgi:cytochrome c oxidase assembly protein subunit 15
VMRHTKAGLAIPDFPLSLGRVVPPLATFPVAIAFAHRVGALLVAVAVIVTTRSAFRDTRPGLRRAAILLLALVAVQIALGALTVLSGKAVAITTAHVFTGAMLLGATLALCVASLRWPVAGLARLTPHASRLTPDASRLTAQGVVWQ